MDDAEACFILSSRNEVDRMAAVRTMNELSAIAFCQLWAVTHLFTETQFIYAVSHDNNY